MKYGILDVGLINSKNGKQQIPHVDTLQDNGGFIVLHTLDGEEAVVFYMGEIPSEVLQRTMLGMTKKKFDEEVEKFPSEYKTVAPLLQPKEELLRR